MSCAAVTATCAVRRPRRRQPTGSAIGKRARQAALPTLVPSCRSRRWPVARGRDTTRSLSSVAPGRRRRCRPRRGGVPTDGRSRRGLAAPAGLARPGDVFEARRDTQAGDRRRGTVANAASWQRTSGWPSARPRWQGPWSAGKPCRRDQPGSSGRAAGARRGDRRDEQLHRRPAGRRPAPDCCCARDWHLRRRSTHAGPAGTLFADELVRLGSTNGIRPDAGGGALPVSDRALSSGRALRGLGPRRSDRRAGHRAATPRSPQPPTAASIRARALRSNGRLERRRASTCPVRCTVKLTVSGGGEDVSQRTLSVTRHEGADGPVRHGRLNVRVGVDGKLVTSGRTRASERQAARGRRAPAGAGRAAYGADGARSAGRPTSLGNPVLAAAAYPLDERARHARMASLRGRRRRCASRFPTSAYVADAGRVRVAFAGGDRRGHRLRGRGRRGTASRPRGADRSVARAAVAPIGAAARCRARPASARRSRRSRALGSGGWGRHRRLGRTCPTTASWRAASRAAASAG